MMNTGWHTRTDGDLLRETARNPEAFDELYRRYELVVAAFFRRRDRDVETTADLTAETFAVALLHADRFRDDGSPAAGWLLGIANHLLLKSLRRDRTDARARQRLGVERIQLTDASLERVEQVLDAELLRNRLRHGLRGLPADQAEAIHAHILDGQPYHAAAAALGVPQATVRKRVSRGLARLRTSLEGTR